MTTLLLESLSDLVRRIVREELATVATPEPAVRLLSVGEAADALGIGRTALYDQVRSGRLRSVKVGRRRLIPTDAIADFAERAET